jgi:heme-degrading monooxygenase HmoA
MNIDAKYVRVNITKFKPGKRDEGNRLLEGYLKEKGKGYTGYLTLYSLDDPNTATYVTFWDSEEAMVDSLNKNREKVMKELSGVIAGTDMKHSIFKDMKRM